MNLLFLSWRNVIIKPLSLALSWILFALGVGLVTFLVLFNSQLQEKFDNNLAGINLIIGAKGSPLQLVLCNMYHIDVPTGNISVKSASPFLNPKHPLIKRAIPLSLGDSYKGYRIVGTTYAFFDLYEAQIEKGRLYRTTYEVVIGDAVARQLNIELGQRFKSTHGLTENEDFGHDNEFEVVGILGPKNSVIDQLILTDPRSIWAVHEHHDTDEMQEMLPDTISSEDFDLTMEKDREITSLLIQFRGRNFQTLNMARNINEHTDMQAAVPAMEINRLFLMMGIGIDALRWLALIIIVVSVLSVFVALLQSFQSRKYELAIMRVQGASRIQIFLIILIEGIIISIIGFLLGSISGHLSMYWAKEYLDAHYRYSFDSWIWHPWEYYIAMGSVLLGIFAALLPAIYAYRTDIHKTLTEDLK